MEALIENGFARVEAGAWLTGRAQPAACCGTATSRALAGFVVPDRSFVHRLETTGEAWCARADAPFLTRLDALPDEPLSVVSEKLLVAPLESRVGAKALKLVPFSFQRSCAVTQLKKGWAVLATASRTTRLALAEGDTLAVRPEALAAWLGQDPTGFCPRLSVLDMLLPRGPKNLTFSFHGPAVVWFEGSGVRLDRATSGRHPFVRKGGCAW